MRNLQETEEIQCGLCREIMQVKYWATHVRDTHTEKANAPIQVYCVYRMSQQCSVCGETREYVVADGYGPDYSPTDNWHFPCPNAPKKPTLLTRLKELVGV